MTRVKRKAVARSAQAIPKPYRPPMPPDPLVLLVWMKQQSCLFHSLRIDVLREVFLYLAPTYLVGYHNCRLYAVDIARGKAKILIQFPFGFLLSYIQHKDKIFFFVGPDLTMLQLPSAERKLLPSIPFTFGLILHIRFYSDCLYAFVLNSVFRDIQRLRLGMQAWEPCKQTQIPSGYLKGEILCNNSWIFIFCDGRIEWFSFESQTFRPAVHWALPDFTLMGDVLGEEGKVVLLGPSCTVFKANLATMAIEKMQGPKHPWVHPKIQKNTALVCWGETMYWLMDDTMRSIDLKSGKKTEKQLHLT